MTKAIRQQVFEKYDGRCAYCGCQLTDKWQVDHMVSKRWNQYLHFWSEGKEGNNPDAFENLMPACVPCNHYKRSMCIESQSEYRGFRNFMMSFHLRLKRLPKKTTVPKTAKKKEYLQVIADKYGITPDSPFTGQFYFENQIKEEDKP